MKSDTSFVNSIKQYILENELLYSRDICLAVSGGADSVAMLLAFLELREEWGLALSVRHFEHGIRGEESLNDAEFVRKLCDMNDIPFFLGQDNVPLYAKTKGLSVEEAARRLRYKFLLECREKTIATAHNMNDNVETFIFNLVRGTGIPGLCGINSVIERDSRYIIRPLLNMTRAEIEEYLKEKNQDYKIDKTNFDTEYTRNKIRCEILPGLMDINKNAIFHINNASRILKAGRKHEERELEEIIKRASLGASILISEIISLDPYMQAEVIHKWLFNNTVFARDIGRTHLNLMLSLINNINTGTGEIHIPGYTVKREYDRLILLDNKKSKAEPDSEPDIKITKSDIEARGFLSCEFNENIIELRLISKEERTDFPDKKYTKWLDYDKIVDDFSLRTCKAGDYFTINSLLNRKRYSRYCIDEKIPIGKRGTIPLLVENGHIIWALGYRISEYYKVGRDTNLILEASLKEGTDGGNT